MNFFFEFLTPSTLGGCNFLNSNPFFTIFSVPDVQIGEFKFYLDSRNNGALPLEPACPEHLRVCSPAILP